MKDNNNSSSTYTSNNSNSDADLLAKTTLREVSDEVEQLLELQQSGGASSRDIGTTARFLTEKYIDARLVRRTCALCSSHGCIWCQD